MDTSGWYIFLTKKACNEVCFFLCVHKDQSSFITYVEQKFEAIAVLITTQFSLFRVVLSILTPNTYLY